MISAQLRGWGLGLAIGLSLLTVSATSAHAQTGYIHDEELSYVGDPEAGPVPGRMSWKVTVTNPFNTELPVSSTGSSGYSPTGSEGILTAPPNETIIRERGFDLTIKPGGYVLYTKLYRGKLGEGGTVMDESEAYWEVCI